MSPKYDLKKFRFFFLFLQQSRCQSFNLIRANVCRNKTRATIDLFPCTETICFIIMPMRLHFMRHER